MRSIVPAASMVFVCLSPVGAQPDSLDGPWATANGNNAATAATTEIPYTLGTGPVEEAWKIDVRAEGHDRVSGRGPITFDAAGNIYWKTSTGGGTNGQPRVVSVSPEGEIRWFGNDGAGNVHALGNGSNRFDSTAVVVGKNAAYAVGADQDPVDVSFLAAAYDKTDGHLLWETPLLEAAPPDAPAGNEGLTPVLHEGKLYIAAGAKGTNYTQQFYRLDAATGGEERSATLADITIKVYAHPTFVPHIFGQGEHGLFFNSESGGSTDGIMDVYAIRWNAEGAGIAWSAEGGKVGRSHLVYSEATGNLYAHTWSDYGAQLYSYVAADGGPPIENTNLYGTGHGFYDIGSLDFSGEELIVGGFDGHLIRYTDDGFGTTTSSAAFDGPEWWGEYRIYGQLLRDEAGDSILISGTNSRSDLGEDYNARVIALNVTKGETLWEYDSGVVQDHAFTVRGGPVAGPDGKVYYFNGVTGELVALRAATAPAGLFVRGDTNCSGGRVDLSDGITVFNFLFLSGTPPCCEEIKDTNDDGRSDITDGIYVLNHLFLGTTPPPAPFPDCGADPGGASCEAHTFCNPPPV